MSKINFIIIFLYFLNCSAQKNKDIYGKVYYKINPKELSKKNNNAEVAKSINQILSKSKNIEFILDFYNHESLFYKNKVMNSDNDVLTNSLASTFSGGDYYTNISDSLLINKREVFGETLLINSKDFYSKPWKLTGKKKQISDLLCLEAKKTKVIKNSKGVFSFEVVAWFTPEIPVSFGPKDAIGLPGLVLEFNDTHFIYTATKIQLKHEAPKINIFKGKIINENEYANLIEQVSNGYKNSLKN